MGLVASCSRCLGSRRHRHRPRAVGHARRLPARATGPHAYAPNATWPAPASLQATATWPLQRRSPLQSPACASTPPPTISPTDCSTTPSASATWAMTSPPEPRSAKPAASPGGCAASRCSAARKPSSPPAPRRGVAMTASTSQDQLVAASQANVPRRPASLGRLRCAAATQLLRGPTSFDPLEGDNHRSVNKATVTRPHADARETPTSGQCPRRLHHRLRLPLRSLNGKHHRAGTADGRHIAMTDLAESDA